MAGASAGNSTLDLDLSGHETGRRDSQVNSLNSATGSATSIRAGSIAGTTLHDNTPPSTSADMPPPPLNANHPPTGHPPTTTETACFVYLDLQIYTLEQDVYLVDFKNAGYEPIVGEKRVRGKGGETKTVFVGNGLRKAEKDVTSPQPYLDLANRLVFQLATRSEENS